MKERKELLLKPKPEREGVSASPRNEKLTFTVLRFDGTDSIIETKASEGKGCKGRAGGE